MARGRHPTRIHVAPPDAATADKYFLRWEGRLVRHEVHRFPSITSEELFGNNHPIEIDFGCGTGVWTCKRALISPSTNILGIDKSQKPVFCAIQRAVDEKIDNIKFVRGDFTVMLPLLKPASVQVAYYLFPIPPRDYFRERANSGRRHFLQSIYASLVPGGRLYFATDAPSYYTCMEDIVKRDLCYNTLPENIDTYEIMSGYRSLWKDRGRTVMSIIIEKPR